MLFLLFPRVFDACHQCCHVLALCHVAEPSFSSSFAYAPHSFCFVVVLLRSVFVFTLSSLWRARVFHREGGISSSAVKEKKQKSRSRTPHPRSIHSRRRRTGVSPAHCTADHHNNSDTAPSTRQQTNEHQSRRSGHQLLPVVRLR